MGRERVQEQDGERSTRKEKEGEKKEKGKGISETGSGIDVNTQLFYNHLKSQPGHDNLGLSCSGCVGS